MDIDVAVIIQLYKEELAKLQNENIILKAQILKLQQPKVEEHGDEE